MPNNKDTMKNHAVAAITLTSFLLPFAGDASSESPATPPGVYSFGFDDLMTMLVAPRHLKLHLSGTGSNWELAAAEARNLRAALARISQTFPKYLGIGVAEAASTLFEPKLKAVETAIAAADSKKFVAAYAEMTDACNACHVYMERPYVVIKVPGAATASAYPNQEFLATP